MLSPDHFRPIDIEDYKTRLSITFAKFALEADKLGHPHIARIFNSYSITDHRSEINPQGPSLQPDTLEEMQLALQYTGELKPDGCAAFMSSLCKPAYGIELAALEKSHQKDRWSVFMLMADLFNSTDTNIEGSTEGVESYLHQPYLQTEAVTLTRAQAFKEIEDYAADIGINTSDWQDTFSRIIDAQLRADELKKPIYSVSEGAFYRRDTVIPYARLLYGIVGPNDNELENKFVSQYMQLQTMDDWLDVLEDEYTQVSPAVALLRNPDSPLKVEFDDFIERNGNIIGEDKGLRVKYLKWLRKKLRSKQAKPFIERIAEIYDIEKENILI